MTIRENQARAGIALVQPGLTRQVARIVARGATDNLVPGTHVSMDELHRYQLLGRKLQARATAEALGSLFRALVWPWKKLAAGIAQISREAAGIRQLSAMDDHLLEDIGIRREQIPAAVAGLIARPAHADAAPATVVERRAEARIACNDPHVKAAA